MNVLVDTNVIMDVLVGREQFLTMSRFVIELCHRRIIDGYMAAHSITNLFYMLRKYYPSDECHDIIFNVFEMFTIVEVDGHKLRIALKNKAFKDFEDCLQVECGKDANVDYIITRDLKDFSLSEIPCLSPQEFYERYSDRA